MDKKTAEYFEKTVTPRFLALAELNNKGYEEASNSTIELELRELVPMVVQPNSGVDLNQIVEALMAEDDPRFADVETWQRNVRLMGVKLYAIGLPPENDPLDKAWLGEAIESALDGLREMDTKDHLSCYAKDGQSSAIHGAIEGDCRLKEFCPVAEVRTLLFTPVREYLGDASRRSPALASTIINALEVGETYRLVSPQHKATLLERLAAHN